MGQNSHSENLSVHLDEFTQQMHRLGKSDNPTLISKIVMRWTKGQPLLTKKLLQYILQSKQKIAQGKEALVIEKIIRNRLLKEFKQDDLTLSIRKLLYKVNLEEALKITNGKITDNEQVYLSELQKELGLSNLQCQTIFNSLAGFDDLPDIDPDEQVIIDRKSQRKRITQGNNQQKGYNIKSSDLLIHQTALSPTFDLDSKYKRKGNIFRKPWFLLLVFILVFYLLTRSINWNQSFQSNIATESLTQQQKQCVDLTSRQSPRMSLGEKLLTQEYNHLQPKSVMPLYEGSSAFARCELVIAKNKFQQSLAINKNNPEALIYLNNIAAITQDHLKIAVSVPLGKDREISWEILRGVAQAQAEINQKGGIRQKLLLVQVVDDNNDPKIIDRVAEQLVADKSILAVIGHNDSDASLAGSKVYQKHGLVMITPTSSSTELSGIGKYILRTAFSVTALTNALADYASVKSLSNITICFDSDSSASTTFVEEFVSEMTNDGARETAVKCDFAQRDFNPQLVVQQAIAKDSDALLLVPSVKRIVHAVLVAQANQQQLPLLGNHTLYAFETIEQGQDAFAEMVLPSPWLSDAHPNSSFLNSATKYWGGRVSWRTATAHDATLAIIKGLEKSNTRSKLQSVMTKPNFVVDGATGKFSFKQGDRFGQVDLAYIKESEVNSGKYQFSELKLNK
ncbi:ABC transporter substrate-binding protein (modular protein) [Hyella patelloides LEGE 07179]|uniref:ABC transporter substrate-binding protein (Modular protein) n=1 Tax=Hyella patelloides LEGE 07179 TaxID=945734 RepID=A0A563W3V2_9CYAN|nr:ABC transporter substrate-binding protein [Hyella patelloides]VEP18356.1 ABC transporter substrate-binding protein (modular protein) [Hyella patelloides LEGE 07179]